MFLGSPTCPSLFLPSSWRVLVCDIPHFQAHECPPPSSSLLVGESLFSDALCFQAHQPAPLSSSPPESEPSFVTCHVPKLTNPLLPLPPLHLVSPCVSRAPTQSPRFLPSL